MEGIKITITIAPGDHVLGLKILHRDTKRIKFNRTKVVTSKATNKNKFFYDVRGDKDIVQVKIVTWIRKRSGTGCGNGDGCPVINNNMWRSSGRRIKR